VRRSVSYVYGRIWRSGITIITENELLSLSLFALFTE
jgi:hypothetical protein